MNIHEHQAKAVLKEYGVAVPRGFPAFSVEEAVQAAQKAQQSGKPGDAADAVKAAEAAEKAIADAEHDLGGGDPLGAVSVSV